MILCNYVKIKIRKIKKVGGRKMENKEIIKKLDEIEKRLDVLEKGTTQKSGIKIRDLSNPNELKDGRLVYAGRFKTNDGQVSSIFGSNVAKIDDIMSYDSGELANIIEAFASRERLDIIKALLLSNDILTDEDKVFIKSNIQVWKIFRRTEIL